MKFLLGLWWTLLAATVRSGEATAGDNQNALAFNVLCSVYNEARGVEKFSFGEEKMKAAAKEEMDEIDRLFTITATDEYLENGPTSSDEAGETAEARSKRLENWRNDKKTWMEEKETYGGNQVLKYPRPPNSVDRARAHEQIQRIKHLAQKQFDKLTDALKGVDSSVNLIKAAAKASIFGAGRDSVDNSGGGTFTTDYATSCGGAGGSAGPGKSLVNDLVCVCTGAESTHGQHVCGLERFQTSLSSSKHFNQPSDGPAPWGVIKDPCEKLYPLTTPSEQSILRSLATFRTSLGLMQHHTTVPGEYILGATGGQTGGCDGSTSQDRVCVNYKQQLHGKEDGFGQINWYAQMRDVAHGLRGLSEKNRTVELILDKIDALKNAAWISYQGALTMPEAGLPQGKTPEASDNQLVAPVTSVTEAEKVKQGMGQTQTYASLLCTTMGLVI